MATRTFTGTVAAGESVDLAFQTGGDIVTIAVRVGERVDAGTVVATLDPTPLELELAEREAALADARARLTEAEANLARKRQLRARGVEPEAALDTAAAAATSAAAQVRLAQATLERVRERLDDTALRAPYAGRIAAQFAEPSQVVRAGDPILRIEGEASAAEIVIDVPESVVARIAEGEVHGLVDPDGKLREAVIAEIGTRSSGTATFPVTLAIPDSDGLRVGVTRRVRLSLAGGAEPSLRVPSSAIAVGPRRNDRGLRLRRGHRGAGPGHGPRLRGRHGTDCRRHPARHRRRDARCQLPAAGAVGHAARHRRRALRGLTR